jgi:hypothetical protein
MTEARSAGRELFQTRMPIYRRPSMGSGGAATAAAKPAGESDEAKAASDQAASASSEEPVGAGGESGTGHEVASRPEPVVLGQAEKQIITQAAEAYNMRVRVDGLVTSLRGAGSAVLLIGQTYLLIRSIREQGVLNTVKDVAVGQAETLLIMRLTGLGALAATGIGMLATLQSDQGPAYYERNRIGAIASQLMQEAFPDLTIRDKRYWELYEQMRDMVKHPFVLETGVSDLAKMVHHAHQEELEKEKRQQQMARDFLKDHPEFSGTPGRSVRED